MSFIAQVMQPGGGVMLLPFVRVVIAILLVLTIGGVVADVARIHMAILSFLCTGLLFSLSMFESEYKKMQDHRSSEPPTNSEPSNKGTNTKTVPSKTD
jgi:hypothetical protein